MAEKDDLDDLLSLLDLNTSDNPQPEPIDRPTARNLLKLVHASPHEDLKTAIRNWLPVYVNVYGDAHMMRLILNVTEELPDFHDVEKRTSLKGNNSFGSGTVYKGNWCPKLEKTGPLLLMDDLPAKLVAIKLLKDEYRNVSVVPRRRKGKYVNEPSVYLKHEIRMWLRIPWHVNVLPFIGLWWKDNGEDVEIGLVSPLLTKNSIEWVTATHPSDGELIRLLLDAAKGLQHLHQAGIYHGAFLPGNLLVDHDNRGVIADFSLSRDRNTPESSGIQVLRMQMLHRWQTPEMIKNSTLKPDRDTDVYLFANVAYRLTTDQPPFHAIPDAEVDGYIMKGNIPDRIDRLEMKENNSLWELMTWCWRKDPADRPKIGQLVECIENLLQELNLSQSSIEEDQEDDLDDWI